MTTRELDQIRTELQHAREDAPNDVRESIENITRAIQRLDERDDDPKPDRLESIREELSRLESDTEGDVEVNLQRIRDHLRVFEERHDLPGRSGG